RSTASSSSIAASSVSCLSCVATRAVLAPGAPPTLAGWSHAHCAALLRPGRARAVGGALTGAGAAARTLRPPPAGRAARRAARLLPRPPHGEHARRLRRPAQRAADPAPQGGALVPARRPRRAGRPVAARRGAAGGEGGVRYRRPGARPGAGAAERPRGTGLRPARRGEAPGRALRRPRPG